MELYFVHSEYLSFLFVIPLLIFIHFISIRFTRRVAMKFSNFEAISRVKGIDLYSKNLIVIILACIIILLLSFSLAELTVKVPMKVSEFSFIIALDSSQSMEAVDILPDRMSAAKTTALDFVDFLGGKSKIGVVSFAGSTIIEQTLSEDRNLIKKAIAKINVTSIGGTDISEAMMTSVNMLAEEENKAIIILSDGQINTGSLDEAVEYAKKYEVIVHTIGVGTSEGGQTSYGLSKLDRDALKSLAYNTKGTYSDASNNQQLKDSFENILKFKMRDVPFNLSKHLSIFALILFVLEFILISTRFKIYP